MTLAASDMKWMEWARSVSLLLLSRVTTVLDELAGIVCERWRVQRVPREEWKGKRDRSTTSTLLLPCSSFSSSHLFLLLSFYPLGSNADRVPSLIPSRVARDFQLLIGRKSSEDRMIFEGFQRDVSSPSPSLPSFSSFLTAVTRSSLRYPPSGPRPNLRLHQIPLLHPSRDQRNLSQGTQLGTHRCPRTQPRLPRRFQTSLHPPFEQDRKLKHGRKDGGFPRDRSSSTSSSSGDRRRQGSSEGGR